MSGNTEEMADHIAGVIRETENEIEVIDIMDSPEASILEQYDGIILGAYTWGDGDLPDDFLDFYDAMDSIDLTGKKRQYSDRVIRLIRNTEWQLTF